jgi:hypothetical protein
VDASLRRPAHAACLPDGGADSTAAPSLVSAAGRHGGRVSPVRIGGLPVARWVISAAFAAGANLVPLLGVLAWDWSSADLIALYWAETVLIGLFAIVRILLARKPQPPDADLIIVKGKPVGRMTNALAVPFFCLHFGGLMAVYGYFLHDQFGATPASVHATWPALAAFAASHAFSLIFNYLGAGEYLETSADQAVLRPYPRIIPMHLMVVLGGFLFARGSGADGYLMLLIGMKTAGDLLSHFAEHKDGKNPRESNVA